MKSYIQGLITGGVFVFALMVLIGSANKSEVGRYQLHNNEEHRYNNACQWPPVPIYKFTGRIRNH